jgi:hypothetical protein
MLGVSMFTACTPKDTPRYVHEGPKTWTSAQAPVDNSVGVQEMSQFNTAEAYRRLKDPKQNYMPTVLQPLARFVLNAKFVQTPANRIKLAELVSIFNSAFLAQLEKGDNSPEFLKMKVDYYNTVFSGCSRDLKRDCTAADMFSGQPRHMRILTLLAKELDPQIQAQIKAAGTPSKCIENSPDCRRLVEERYRRLAMAAYNNHSHYDDEEFTRAYLKYASLFGMFLDDARNCRADESQEKCGERLKKAGARSPEYASLAFGYIADVHAHIFQTIIANYKPSDYDDPEFKSLVENFNPWTYSIKQANAFKYASSVMFEFGTKCCMYSDAGHSQLSPSVKQAIEDSQNSSDHFVPTFGLSFRELIQNIKSEHQTNKDKKNEKPAYDGQEYSLFKNLGVFELAQQIERGDPRFFNEYFFIVDRLFRGHLTSQQVERVLRNTNPERARKEFPLMITNYMKIYLIYMVVETNRYMAAIYNSPSLASDRVFEEAVNGSHDLTDRWHALQGDTDLLNTLLGSYFKSLNTQPASHWRAGPVQARTKAAVDWRNWQQADQLLKSVNRNIHYLSVFPNMMIMTYYLTKRNGSVKFKTFWGQEIEIDGTKILKSLFNGDVPGPWLNFGVDAVAPDRLMNLYSLEYLLSTEGLRPFVLDDEKKTVAGNRSQFFDIIFSKYLDDSVSQLRKEISDYDQKTVGDSSNLTQAKALCKYELTPAIGTPPPVDINFLELETYTYAGMAGKGVSNVLKNVLNGEGSALQKLNSDIDSKRTYVKAMVQVITQDILRRNEPLEKHPDLAKARQLLSDLDDMQQKLAVNFMSKSRDYFRCYSTLLDIERRRANRLYDLEREHLGQIFEMMKAQQTGVPDGAALDAKNEEITKNFFRANGYRVDRVYGRSYQMSKYDLLMRMKRRIESDEVTGQPTPREARAYRDFNPYYWRPRRVSIHDQDATERNAMVSEETRSSIYMRGTTKEDKAEFIRQGMTVMNGKAESYIHWQSGLMNDTTLIDYLTTLESFYLLGKVQTPDGKTLEITPKELADTYVKVIASYSMDEIDQQNVADFGVAGFRSKEFFMGRLWERDGQTRDPLFFSLMADINKLADVSLKGHGPVREALDFATAYDSLQAFIFKPLQIATDPANPYGPKDQSVKLAVQDLYGARAHRQLQRIADLFAHLKTLEDGSTIERIDPRLAQPFYYESGNYPVWYDLKERREAGMILDLTKYKDHGILIDDFAGQTKNFYKTLEKVKVP